MGLCTVCGVAGRGETLDVVPRLLITGVNRGFELIERHDGIRSVLMLA